MAQCSPGSSAFCLCAECPCKARQQVQLPVTTQGLRLHTCCTSDCSVSTRSPKPPLTYSCCLIRMIFEQEHVQSGFAPSRQMSVPCGRCTNTQRWFCCWQSLSSIFCGIVTRRLCCFSVLRSLEMLLLCHCVWAAVWVPMECLQVMASSSPCGTAFFLPLLCTVCCLCGGF